MAELQNDPSPRLTLKAYEADRLNVKYFHDLHKSWIFVTLGHANQNRVFAKALSGINDTLGSKGLRPVFGVSEYRPETEKDIVFDLLSWRSRGVVWADRAAKTNGARLVALSASTASPLSQIADLHIAMPRGDGLSGSSEIYSRILSVALGQTLFECLVAKRPELMETAVGVDDLFGEDRLK